MSLGPQNVRRNEGMPTYRSQGRLNRTCRTLGATATVRRGLMLKAGGRRACLCRRFLSRIIGAIRSVSTQDAMENGGRRREIGGIRSGPWHRSHVDLIGPAQVHVRDPSAVPPFSPNLNTPLLLEPQLACRELLHMAAVSPITNIPILRLFGTNLTQCAGSPSSWL